ncbi:MAG: RNA-binding domain-containing protein [Acidobacteriota bacterium]
MERAELRSRIKRWEDLHTEFKLEATHPDDLAAALVAFANADGGQIILGVSKERKIVGVRDPDKLRQHVDNLAANNCIPPLTVSQEAVGQRGKTVLVVNVSKGEQRPYRTNRGVYFVRTSSDRRQASREELLRLFQATESPYHDETPLVRLSTAEIDLDAVRRFVDETGQYQTLFDAAPERLLRSWRLVAAGHPTIAGLVLFGRNPQEHLPFAQINAARVPGAEIANEPADRKDLTGRLLDVIDQAMRFVRIHLPVPHKTRGLEREPQPEIPEEVLREAIVNAVAHRDYTVHGPIRLFVFDDRIEFHTPGKAPNTVDEEAMRAGVHVVRNPHIYARLSDAGLVTRAGSGIPRMMKLTREATGKDLGISLREFEVLFSIPRRQPSC